MHTDRDGRSADTIVSAHAYPGRKLGQWAYTWAWAFFRLKSFDLLHMGIYIGMGVISVWLLVWANMVYPILSTASLDNISSMR